MALGTLSAVVDHPARADAPMPPPSQLRVCSPDHAFCAVSLPSPPSLSIYPSQSTVARWSLPAFHRYFFLADGGENLVLGPEGLNLLPLDVKVSDPLLVFMHRTDTVRIVKVGDLFPNLTGLVRTASHLKWGSIAGISAQNRLVVELADGKHVTFDVATGLRVPVQ